jgi:hypothetical protein
VEGPGPPREGAAARLGRSAEARGLSAASWAGRGDQERGLSLLALVLAGAYFVVLFLPWIGNGVRFSQSGWFVAHDPGVLVLAVVLVESLRLARAWVSRGAILLGFCLVGAAGVLGVESLANLRWGGLFPEGFRAFQYGAWIGLVLAILLIAVAALRLAVLWRSAP